ncbi:glutathione S-transferase N-terminal domain-containing protein [Deltaproteobacteria bacterium TL4]
MTALEALDELITIYGSQAAVSEKLGRSRGTVLKKQGNIGSKVLEEEILHLWQKHERKKKAAASHPRAQVSSPKTVKSPKKALGGNTSLSGTGADSFISMVVSPPKPSTSVPLVLFQEKHNPSCKRIRSALERKQLKYEAITVKRKSEYIHEINERMGRFKLPVLQHGDLWMDGIQDILSYLDQTFPGEKPTSLMENIMDTVLPVRRLFRGNR